jgi:hypothetical protein
MPVRSPVVLWTAGAADILHICDVMATSGWLANMERGPGRHGVSNAFFLYVCDPDAVGPSGIEELVRGRLGVRGHAGARTGDGAAAGGGGMNAGPRSVGAASGCRKQPVH